MANERWVCFKVRRREKDPCCPALKKANKALREKYNVDGFPTFVVLNDQGKEIGRQVGYAEGGAKAFIAKLEKFKGK